MDKIGTENIVLFATNTGELYQEHKQMARDKTPVRAAGLAKSWLSHVSGRVLTLYGKQVEPCWAPLATRIRAAEELKEYYERHIRE